MLDDVGNVNVTSGIAGHVYILTSPKSGSVKIGGTVFPPFKRIKEINSYPPYCDCGPWTLWDFRQVSDWRKVESFSHYAFRSSLDSTVVGAKELFSVAPQRVSAKLSEIDPHLIVNRPKIDRMFQDEQFAHFIEKIFVFTGLLNWLDIQGAWVFTIFSSTSGGRYYTISIGTYIRA